MARNKRTINKEDTLDETTQPFTENRPGTLQEAKQMTANNVGMEFPCFHCCMSFVLLYSDNKPQSANKTQQFTNRTKSTNKDEQSKHNNHHGKTKSERFWDGTVGVSLFLISFRGLHHDSFELPGLLAIVILVHYKLTRRIAAWFIVVQSSYHCK